MTNKEWFAQAQFGMMIHWGLYSLLGGEWNGQRTPKLGEWIMYDQKIPVAEYEKLAGAFNPVFFDPEKWVTLAKDAGMQYIVITAKHHEGFALYHSANDPYNVVDATPYGFDNNWKSVDRILEIKKHLNDRGVNYLLNVGPDALGRIPVPSVEILKELAARR